MYKAKSASLAQHFYHGGTSARSQGLDDTCRRGSKKCNTCVDKILKRKTRLIALFEKFLRFNGLTKIFFICIHKKLNVATLSLCLRTSPTRKDDSALFI